MFGSELSLLSNFTLLERIYIRIFGTLSDPTVVRYLKFKYSALRFFKRNKIQLNKILDYGCSWGNFGFKLGRLNKRKQIFLYDINPEAVSKCNEIIDTGKYANVGLLNQSGYEKSDNFSLILLIHVLEHIENDVYFLEKMSKKLEIGGYLYINVPEYSGEVLSDWDRQIAHFRTGYNNGALKMLLEKIGFKIIYDTQYYKGKPLLICSFFRNAYNRLLHSLEGKYLNFKNFSQLGIFQKLILGFIWPLYRFFLELNFFLRHLIDQDVILFAQKITQE